ncbi:MAG: UDP-3-O-[3-hydroxymyristoyl] N-acetylglucosamine deacetylase [Alphaproteobacteria bacterium]|jgi:UDP-3-O-[3-hydroxymyristoyl] N-acetylglucosamine deacetylase
MTMQRTIKETVSISGIGLHTGNMVNVKLKPAEEYTGIVFHRTDVTPGAGSVTVCASAVTDSDLCTELENEHKVRVGTVEHLMATLYALEIDNIIIELDGEELPVLDGSSEPWVVLLDKAGVAEQSDPRKSIKILKEVVVKQGNSVASVKPSGHFNLHVFIHYGADIPPQKADFTASAFEFRRELSKARTFCFERDIEYMRSMGKAKGGSLENALVFNEQGVPLNEEGMRYEDEPLRHKALDAIGDFYISGYRIVGSFNLTRPGHEMNNMLLRAILENPANWKWI